MGVVPVCGGDGGWADGVIGGRVAMGVRRGLDRSWSTSVVVRSASVRWFVALGHAPVKLVSLYPAGSPLIDGIITSVRSVPHETIPHAETQ